MPELQSGQQTFSNQMADVTIYHNPRCSKSRQALALLRAQGIEPQVVEYLKAPPSESELATIAEKLGVSPNEMVRGKEVAKLDLPPSDDPREWIRRMAEHPQIIERPIVVCGGRARIGRPPENILPLLA